MADARGVIRLPIGELGTFNVRVTFDTIRKLEAKFGPMGHIQQRVQEYRFGMTEAFEFLSMVLRLTEQDEELPPPVALQEELVRLGLTQATVLCMPVMYLAVDGAQALPMAQSFLDKEEDGEGKANTPSGSTLQ